MKKQGNEETKVFQRLTTALVVALAVLLAGPVHAQVKWKHALLLAKGNAGFFWMALEKDYFKKRGLDVEFLQFRGDKFVVRALLAGEVDSAEVSPAASMIAIEHGADLRFFGAGQPGFPYALFVRKDVTSWDQLKDKTFGVSSPGAVPEIIARAMLTRKGVDDSSIKVVAAGGSGARIKALVAGKVDAVASSSQYSADADKLGIKVMAYAADLVPEYPSTVFIAEESTLKAKPKAAVSFVAGYMEGIDYALTHRDETLELAGKMNNKPANDRELVYTFDEAIKYGFLTNKSEIPRAKIEWLQNLLLKTGRLKNKLDLNKYIDETYRKEALKSVHLSYVQR
jgi:NitT/TauT family transport system substrate-binding protein